MDRNSKIFVAGHNGLVGSAIVNRLRAKGYMNIVCRPRRELDLTDAAAVDAFFAAERPEYVFLAAAKVGGIVANNRYRADFIYENLQIQNHVIGCSHRYGVTKLLFLGSTCVYPANAPQPMEESCLLTSPLEYTNEPYALAKIAGLKMCESFNLQYGTNFIAVMPTNLYGPNDNFDLEKSHVLPALIRKIYLGKCLIAGAWDSIRSDLNKRPVEGVSGVDSDEVIARMLAHYGVCGSKGSASVEIWGSGTPTREFLWSEEMADACVFVMERVEFDDLTPSDGPIRNCHINIGTGREISIRALAELIARVIGFDGTLLFDATKPDGTMRKLTDPSKLQALGWRHTIEIEEGVRLLFEWYTS